MPKYSIKLTDVFEGEVEAPTEELAQEQFNDMLFDEIEPQETWEITQLSYSDE